MKQALIFIPFFLMSLNQKNSLFFDKGFQEKTRNFHLQFMTVGFGSNMFRMEPVFTVNGTKFVYTFEEVWILPGKSKIEKDTLLMGSFRTSSMDSILKFIRELKDTAIYRTNIHIMSGSASYITIKDDLKKVKFDLHNASDTTADKIVEILNTYIPITLDKLYICCKTSNEN